MARKHSLNDKVISLRLDLFNVSLFCEPVFLSNGAPKVSEMSIGPDKKEGPVLEVEKELEEDYIDKEDL